MTSTIWSMFADKARDMANGAMDDIASAADWNKVRPARQTEFLRALSLDPFPNRCDPAVREFGETSGTGFRVRKIGFQILPDCWASAAIFYPDPLPAGRHPGVLYLCGHAALGIQHYHEHPILWARRGYVCLILETIEQTDNPGEHHGANLGWFERWVSLGYTAAGGELWNSICALDVLSDDPAVDPTRLAATGVSGGGSISFLLAAVDERVRAVSSLCGVSTPADAVANRHLHGHCDCFHPINYQGRDISEYAALIAPRAALFCFADHDNLFHPEETRRFVESTSKVYELMDAGENCRLVTCPGGHGDHPEFDRATQEWFDRHVAGVELPLLDRGGAELSEPETCNFQGEPPFPNHLDLLPGLLSPRGRLPLPRSSSEWASIRDGAIQRLRDIVFANIPKGFDRPGLRLDGDWRWGETPLRDYTAGAEGVEVALRMVIPPTSGKDLVIAVAGEGRNVHHAFAAAATAVDRSATAYAGFEPRWAADRSREKVLSDMPPGSALPPMRTVFHRAMAVTGWTPVKLIVADLLCLIEEIDRFEDVNERRVILYGRGDAGVAALYAAALSPRVGGVVAEGIVGSHSEGASLPGILRNFDLPQTVGLLFPRPVALVNPVYSSWSWPARLYERLGATGSFAVIDTHAAEGVCSVIGSPNLSVDL